MFGPSQAERSAHNRPPKCLRQPCLCSIPETRVSSALRLHNNGSLPGQVKSKIRSYRGSIDSFTPYGRLHGYYGIVQLSSHSGRTHAVLTSLAQIAIFFVNDVDQSLCSNSGLKLRLNKCTTRA